MQAMRYVVTRIPILGAGWYGAVETKADRYVALHARTLQEHLQRARDLGLAQVFVRSSGGREDSIDVSLPEAGVPS